MSETGKRGGNRSGWDFHERTDPLTDTKPCLNSDSNSVLAHLNKCAFNLSNTVMKFCLNSLYQDLFTRLCPFPEVGSPLTQALPSPGSREIKSLEMRLGGHNSIHSKSVSAYFVSFTYGLPPRNPLRTLPTPLTRSCRGEFSFCFSMLSAHDLDCGETGALIHRKYAFDVPSVGQRLWPWPCKLGERRVSPRMQALFSLLRQKY